MKIYGRLPMRDGYGKALLKMCEADEPIMVLDADVAKSTRTVWVRDKYPEHFMDMGISEQDMVGTAAGLALGGVTSFASTYCVFLCGRAWDQIRTTICYNNVNVKFGGAHAGISVGPDGATHQALEDIALMRVLPHMTVLTPCDAIETEKATLAAAKMKGPCFIRFGREPVPVITTPDDPFAIGKATILREGTDVTLIGVGPMTYKSWRAAEQLEKHGVSAEVINLSSVKPLDTDTILKSVKKTGCCIVSEEHQMAGGAFGAVAEFLAKTYPIPMGQVGVNDSFGESGQPDELLDKYGLMGRDIAIEAQEVIARSQKKRRR